MSITFSQTEDFYIQEDSLHVDSGCKPAIGWLSQSAFFFPAAVSVLPFSESLLMHSWLNAAQDDCDWL